MNRREFLKAGLGTLGAALSGVAFWRDTSPVTGDKETGVKISPELVEDAKFNLDHLTWPTPEVSLVPNYHQGRLTHIFLVDDSGEEVCICENPDCPEDHGEDKLLAWWEINRVIPEGTEVTIPLEVTLYT